MASERVICIVGLGYVGLPLALACSVHGPVIGFDANAKRAAELQAGEDPKGLLHGPLPKTLSVTSDPKDIAPANFYIIAVPTPVDGDCQPDLRLLEGACTTVGQALEAGDYVVIESTVYPGATEQVCIPRIEKACGLKAGIDFKVGYSPERISPGDPAHTLSQVVKIIAGQDTQTLEAMREVYSKLVKPPLYCAPSIEVAEAAKILENTQRDLNIALMNQMALLFHHIGLDTQEVLAAAQTKWNFLPFTPGLVGGHCIGVDPYYLTHLATKVGYNPDLILAGRKINDAMGQFVIETTLKQLQAHKVAPSEAIVTILGLTFKENCSDIRNSQVNRMVGLLEGAGCQVHVHDPLAHKASAAEDYGIQLVEWDALPAAHAIILAVPHDPFRNLSPDDFRGKMCTPYLLQDVKACLDRQTFEQSGITIWRL